MKNIVLHSHKGKLMNRRLSLPILFIVASTVSTAALALGVSAVTATHFELNHYLKSKYEISEVVLGTSEHTILGSARALTISGNFLPHALAVLGKAVKQNPRTVAQAFFAEEATLFGLTPASEMREQISHDPNSDSADELGGSHIRYDHYLNGILLYGTWTIVHTRADGKIYYITADVFPITPELLYAITLPTLSKTKISQIAKDDMRAAAKAPDTEPWAKHILNSPIPIPLSFTKAAISVPPYVIWKVEGVWSYTFDAFTGKVLKKLPNWAE